MMCDLEKILSIQSHVVSGYVGNKCYILTLQILGIEIDFINSVQLSNHTGYNSCKGQVLDASDLLELFDGLKENGLTNYSHIATGYIGSRTFLEQVCSIVTELKKIDPSVLYNCDPVLGDNGMMYVPENLLEVYKDKVLPLADVLFPNQFEAELLTGTVIKNEKDIVSTIDLLHVRGIKTVVITSTNLGTADVLFGYVSVISPDGTKERLRLESTRFPFNFVGTGDLFAALFLGWSLKHPGDTKTVCSKVLGSIQIVLQKTIKKAEKMRSRDLGSEVHRLELSLVACISDIMNPPLHSGVVNFSI